jgi:acyl-CoA thioesterase 8
MLFIMQTQAAAHGRGVAMGRIYRQDGTLVAVVVRSCQRLSLHLTC